MNTHPGYEHGNDHQSAAEAPKPQLAAAALPDFNARTQIMNRLLEDHPGGCPAQLDPDRAKTARNRQPMSEFEIYETNESLRRQELKSLGLQRSIYKKLSTYLERSLGELNDHFSFASIINRYRQDLSLTVVTQIGRHLVESVAAETDSDRGTDESQSEQIDADQSLMAEQLKLKSFCWTATDIDGYRIFQPQSGLVDRTTSQVLATIYKHYLEIENIGRKIGSEPALEIEAMTVDYIGQIHQPTERISEFHLRAQVKARFRQLIEECLGGLGPAAADQIRDLGPWEIDSLIWSTDWHRDPNLTAAINRGDSDEAEIAEEESRRLEVVREIEASWPATVLDAIKEVRSGRDQIYQQSLAKVVFDGYRLPFNLLTGRHQATEDKIKKISSRQEQLIYQTPSDIFFG